MVSRSIGTAGRSATSYMVRSFGRGGLIGEVSTRWDSGVHFKEPPKPERVLDFNGRIVSSITNAVGATPVVDGMVQVPVYRESREYVCTIRANKWLPLSIQRVTWTGQHFMNHRVM